ncbi:MAG: DUF418 domain-containing protein [Pseudomonadota bacterium]
MTQRAYMPDYLRLSALFGIVVVNVQAMAYSIIEGFASASLTGTADDVVIWLVNGLAYLKTYGLFSFMFGVGLAFQMRSAHRRALPFGTLYRNRMMGLLVLGLLHGCLLFPYDILVLYAVTGAILYAMRTWSVRSLVRAGAGLLAVQILLASAVLLAPASMDEVTTVEREIMTGGDIASVTLFRTIAFASTLPALVLIQGFSALGWFCLGLAAVKSGLIDRPDHAVWARARRWCLLPGVALSLLAAGLWQWGPEDLGMVMTLAVAPLSTIGYLGLIAAIAKPPGPWMAELLKAGGSSLSIYLGQSIILATVFAPYGLGLWDALHPATAVGLSLAVTLALILALVLWRRWFALGPFEWVLRGITRFRVRRIA